MAIRLKIRFLSFLRPRWGVRGSLFAAFAVIAGIAILISAGAAMVLGHLGASITDLSGKDIPRLAASLQLSAQSATLASQGPALLASESEQALNERSKKIKETQQVTLEKLGEIVELGADIPRETHEPHNEAEAHDPGLKVLNKSIEGYS